MYWNNMPGYTGNDVLRRSILEAYNQPTADPRAGKSEFQLGFVSAAHGFNANKYYEQALTARKNGDFENEARYRAMAEQEEMRAARVAPRVQNFTDINSIGSGLNWAQSAAGQALASAPAAIAGGAIGTVAGTMIGGPVGGAIGGFLGAYPATYALERDEAIGEAMRDPYIYENKTPEEIYNTARVKGLTAGAMEAVVPAVAGGAGRALARGLRPGSMAHRFARGEVLPAMATEALTEGSQSLIGQTAQNYLRDDALTNYDWEQVLNEAAAGAVGGAAMTGPGASARYLRNKYNESELGQKTNERVNDLLNRSKGAQAQVEEVFDKGEQVVSDGINAAKAGVNAAINPEEEILRAATGEPVEPVDSGDAAVGAAAQTAAQPNATPQDVAQAANEANAQVKQQAQNNVQYWLDENNQPVRLADGRAVTKGEGIRYSLGKHFRSVKESNKHVSIFETVEDAMAALPNDQHTQRMREAIAEDPNARSKFYAFRTANEDGTPHVVMIAENIPQGKEFNMFLHEVGVHVGMRQAFQQRYGDQGQAKIAELAQRIQELATTGKTLDERQIAERVATQIKANGITNPEEWIAYFVQYAMEVKSSDGRPKFMPSAFKAKNPVTAILQEILQTFQKFLETVGVKKDIQAQELVDFTWALAQKTDSEFVGEPVTTTETASVSPTEQVDTDIKITEAVEEFASLGEETEATQKQTVEEADATISTEAKALANALLDKSKDTYPLELVAAAQQFKTDGNYIAFANSIRAWKENPQREVDAIFKGLFETKKRSYAPNFSDKYSFALSEEDSPIAKQIHDTYGELAAEEADNFILLYNSSGGKIENFDRLFKDGAAGALEILKNIQLTKTTETTTEQAEVGALTPEADFDLIKGLFEILMSKEGVKSLKNDEAVVRTEMLLRRHFGFNTKKVLHAILTYAESRPDIFKETGFKKGIKNIQTQARQNLWDMRNLLTGPIIHALNDKERAKYFKLKGNPKRQREFIAHRLDILTAWIYEQRHMRLDKKNELKTQFKPRWEILGMTSRDQQTAILNSIEKIARLCGLQPILAKNEDGSYHDYYYTAKGLNAVTGKMLSDDVFTHTEYDKVNVANNVTVYIDEKGNIAYDIPAGMNKKFRLPARENHLSYHKAMQLKPANNQAIKKLKNRINEINRQEYKNETEQDKKLRQKILDYTQTNRHLLPLSDASYILAAVRNMKKSQPEIKRALLKKMSGNKDTTWKDTITQYIDDAAIELDKINEPLEQEKATINQQLNELYKTQEYQDYLKEVQRLQKETDEQFFKEQDEFNKKYGQSDFVDVIEYIKAERNRFDDEIRNISDRIYDVQQDILATVYGSQENTDLRLLEEDLQDQQEKLTKQKERTIYQIIKRYGSPRILMKGEKEVLKPRRTLQKGVTEKQVAEMRKALRKYYAASLPRISEKTPTETVFSSYFAKSPLEYEPKTEKERQAYDMLYNAMVWRDGDIDSAIGRIDREKYEIAAAFEAVATNEIIFAQHQLEDFVQRILPDEQVQIAAEKIALQEEDDLNLQPYGAEIAELNTETINEEGDVIDVYDDNGFGDPIPTDTKMKLAAVAGRKEVGSEGTAFFRPKFGYDIAMDWVEMARLALDLHKKKITRNGKLVKNGEILDDDQVSDFLEKFLTNTTSAKNRMEHRELWMRRGGEFYYDQENDTLARDTSTFDELEYLKEILAQVDGLGMRYLDMFTASIFSVAKQRGLRPIEVIQNQEEMNKALASYTPTWALNFIADLRTMNRLAEAGQMQDLFNRAFEAEYDSPKKFFIGYKVRDQKAAGELAYRMSQDKDLFAVFIQRSERPQGIELNYRSVPREYAMSDSLIQQYLDGMLTEEYVTTETLNNLAKYIDMSDVRRGAIVQDRVLTVKELIEKIEKVADHSIIFEGALRPNKEEFGFGRRQVVRNWKTGEIVQTADLWKWGNIAYNIPGLIRAYARADKHFRGSGLATKEDPIDRSPLALFFAAIAAYQTMKVPREHEKTNKVFFRRELTEEQIKAGMDENMADLTGRFGMLVTPKRQTEAGVPEIMALPFVLYVAGGNVKNIPLRNGHYVLQWGDSEGTYGVPIGVKYSTWLATGEQMIKTVKFADINNYNPNSEEYAVLTRVSKVLFPTQDDLLALGYNDVQGLFNDLDAVFPKHLRIFEDKEDERGLSYLEAVATRRQNAIDLLNPAFNEASDEYEDSKPQNDEEIIPTGSSVLEGKSLFKDDTQTAFRPMWQSLELIRKHLDSGDGDTIRLDFELSAPPQKALEKRLFQIAKDNATNEQRNDIGWENSIKAKNTKTAEEIRKEFYKILGNNKLSSVQKIKDLNQMYIDKGLVVETPDINPLMFTKDSSMSNPLFLFQNLVTDTLKTIQSRIENYSGWNLHEGDIKKPVEPNTVKLQDNDKLSTEKTNQIWEAYHLEDRDYEINSFYRELKELTEKSSVPGGIVKKGNRMVFELNKEYVQKLYKLLSRFSDIAENTALDLGIDNTAALEFDDFQPLEYEAYKRSQKETRENTDEQIQLIVESLKDQYDQETEQIPTNILRQAFGNVEGDNADQIMDNYRKKLLADDEARFFIDSVGAFSYEIRNILTELSAAMEMVNAADKSREVNIRGDKVVKDKETGKWRYAAESWDEPNVTVNLDFGTEDENTEDIFESGKRFTHAGHNARRHPYWKVESFVKPLPWGDFPADIAENKAINRKDIKDVEQLKDIVQKNFYYKPPVFVGAHYEYDPNNTKVVRLSFENVSDNFFAKSELLEELETASFFETGGTTHNLKDNTINMSVSGATFYKILQKILKSPVVEGDVISKKRVKTEGGETTNEITKEKHIEIPGGEEILKAYVKAELEDIPTQAYFQQFEKHQQEILSKPENLFYDEKERARYYREEEHKNIPRFNIEKPFATKNKNTLVSWLHDAGETPQPIRVHDDWQNGKGEIREYPSVKVALQVLGSGQFDEVAYNDRKLNGRFKDKLKKSLETDPKLELPLHYHLIKEKILGNSKVLRALIENNFLRGYEITSTNVNTWKERNPKERTQYIVEDFYNNKDFNNVLRTVLEHIRAEYTDEQLRNLATEQQAKEEQQAVTAAENIKESITNTEGDNISAELGSFGNKRGIVKSNLYRMATYIALAHHEGGNFADIKGLTTHSDDAIERSPGLATPMDQARIINRNMTGRGPYKFTLLKQFAAEFASAVTKLQDKSPNWFGAVNNMLDLKVSKEDLAELSKRIAEATSEPKHSELFMSDGTIKKSVKDVTDYLEKVLGKEAIETKFFENAWGENNQRIYGSFKEEDGKKVIRLAMAGNVLSTAHHEAFHAFLSTVKNNSPQHYKKLIELSQKYKPLVMDILKGKNAENAIKSAENDPEELATYAYQLWMAGLMKGNAVSKRVSNKFGRLWYQIAGLINDQMRRKGQEAVDILEAETKLKMIYNRFNEGQLAYSKDAFFQQLEADLAPKKRWERWDAVSKALSSFGDKVLNATDTILRKSDIPELVQIADMFYNDVVDRDMSEMHARGEKGDALLRYRQQNRIWGNKYNNLMRDFSREEKKLIRKALLHKNEQDGLALLTNDKLKKGYYAIREFFNNVYDDMVEMGVQRRTQTPNEKGYMEWVWKPLEKRGKEGGYEQGYIPMQWNREAIKKNRREFTDLLVEEVAAAIKNGKLYAQEFDSQGNLRENPARDYAETLVAEILGETISDNSARDRAFWVDKNTFKQNVEQYLGFIDDRTKFDKFLSQDIDEMVVAYSLRTAKNAVFQQVFGPDLEKLTTLLQKAREKIAKKHGLDPSDEQVDEIMKPYMHAIDSMMGVLGQNMSPQLRQLNSYGAVYQNVRILATVLFSSFQDVAGLSLHGGTLQDQWNGLIRGLRGAIKTALKKEDRDEIMQRAEEFGIVPALSSPSIMAELSGTQDLDGKVGAFNRAFFRINGMEGWTRSLRAQAMIIAERKIMEWRENGVNVDKEADRLLFKRCFGDINPKDIEMDGAYLKNNEANRIAINRIVDDMVMDPTEANRPVWANDPRFLLFAQLKTFSYTLHRVLLRGAFEQARLGNIGGAAGSLIGLIPTAMAGYLIKEILLGMLSGDDDDDWKYRWDNMLPYVLARSGIGGIPQMYLEDIYALDPAKMAGPMFDQLQGIASIPIRGQFGVSYHHTTGNELLAAMPASNVLKRLPVFQAG